MVKLFYLVQSGCNVPVALPGGKAWVVVEESHVPAALDHYDRLLRNPVGALVAMDIDEYHERYVLPELVARRLAQLRAIQMVAAVEARQGQNGHARADMAVEAVA